MKRYLLLLLLGMAARPDLQAQAVERKIIIQNKLFYYTSIDAEFQLATLHIGKISEPLEKATSFALPAGRNYDAPVNPFAWDILDSMVYAVNFLNHPLNDRNEALKRFPLASLQVWDSTVTSMDMLMKSVDQHTFVLNDPYQFILKRSNVLSNFYFDGIALSDSSYCMAVANNGEISIWNYDGRGWTHGTVQKNITEGYFSLIVRQRRPYLLMSNGFIHEIVSNALLPVTSRLNFTPSEGIIVVDRDRDTIRFISNNDLNRAVPLNELLQKKAKTIF